MLLNIKYVECPHCKKWYSYSELMSYTSHGGAKCWSDGKSFDHTFSEYSFLPFAKCEVCDNFFWFNNCNQLEDHEIHHFLEVIEQGQSAYEKLVTEEKNIEKYKIIKAFLKENQEKYLNENENFRLDYPPYHYWEDMANYFMKDLLELLNNMDDLNPDNEIFVRVRLWQHINDLNRSSCLLKNLQLNNVFRFKWLYHLHKRNRTSKKQYKKHELLRLENMQRLSDLLQQTESKDYGDSIILIEIERELGHFKNANKIINKLDPSEKQYYSRFIKKSKRRISRKSKNLFEI